VRLADQRENHVTLFTGSSIAGDLYVSTLDDDSTLTLDGDGTQLYSAAVSGQTIFVQGGTLIKTGSGTWIMDSDGIGAGLAPQKIRIEAGTLEARDNSALTGGTVTVEDGGTLGGSGKVGKLVVASGGIVAPGTGSSIGTLAARYDAATLQLFGEAGYTISAGPVAFEPFAGLSYAALHTGAFDETDPAGVSGAASTSGLALAALGLDAKADLDALHLGGRLAWQHALSPAATSADLDLAGAPMTIRGAPIARDEILAGLNLGLVLSPNAEVALSYAGSFAATGATQSATGELRVTF